MITQTRIALRCEASRKGKLVVRRFPFPVIRQLSQGRVADVTDTLISEAVRLVTATSSEGYFGAHLQL